MQIHRRVMDALRNLGYRIIEVWHIDGSPALLENVKELTEAGGGANVSASPSSQKMLEEGLSGGYDVIVSDHIVPGMDGITFLGQARESVSNTPFVIFTGQWG